MKIVLVTWWYAKGMGYSENCLSEALAAQGHEVHVVSSNLQPDFPNYKEAYEPFIGPRTQSVGVQQVDGYTLHRLPCKETTYGIYIFNLQQYLKRLNPDIVQCFGIPQRSTYQAAVYCFVNRKPLFLEEHTHRSTVRPPASRRQVFDIFAVKYVLGPLVSMVSRHCYAIAPDVWEIARAKFGFSKHKLSIQSLGVNTTLFHPNETQEDWEERSALRSKFGIVPEDVLYIYTGRFSADKFPGLLATAIARLRRMGYPVRGLFIGSGAAEDVSFIKGTKGCVVLPFMPVAELASYYRMADVGVWPKQESTSQLDALACGLPIILSDRVEAKERVEGCGLVYEEGSSESLSNVMRQVLSASDRLPLSLEAGRKVKESYSWTAIANTRIADYASAISGAKR